jgi:hypothetical protein
VARRAEELLSLPVLVRGIELGRPVDLLVDRDVSRAIGFDVLCGDGAHRFLAFAVAAVTDKAIEIETPFVLLDFGQVTFYRKQATTLRELNGDGEVEELVIGRDGQIERETLRSR